MWYSKKQTTLDTATYGSEILVARTFMEQIVSLQNAFRYLGVPVYKTSYVFGGKKLQIKSWLILYDRLTKHHNILSHRYQQSVLNQVSAFRMNLYGGTCTIEVILDPISIPVTWRYLGYYKFHIWFWFAQQVQNRTLSNFWIDMRSFDASLSNLYNIGWILDFCTSLYNQS